MSRGKDGCGGLLYAQKGEQQREGKRRKSDDKQAYVWKGAFYTLLIFIQTTAEITDYSCNKKKRIIKCAERKEEPESIKGEHGYRKNGQKVDYAHVKIDTRTES